MYGDVVLFLPSTRALVLLNRPPASIFEELKAGEGQTTISVMDQSILDLPNPAEEPRLIEAQVCQAERRHWRPSGSATDDIDHLTCEEPLEVRVGQLPIAVLMRTPGHDVELATGFALTEGLFENFAEIARVAHCNSGPHPDNVVLLTPAGHVQLDMLKFQRNMFSSSSCGICGKRSIEQAMIESPALQSSTQFSAHVLSQAPSLLRAQQYVFARTGSLHAAGLMAPDGHLLCVREDIGRHNALDKLIGWAAQNSQVLDELTLVVSGRVSYEIVQKSLAAGLPCIVAVGGVSSLATQLAERAGIVLVGFASPEKLSIYSGRQRIS